MVNVVRAAAFAVLAGSIGLACTSGTSDCTCSVESNGVQRTLACGETSCVGGVAIACGDDRKTVQRGTCVDGPGPTVPAAGDDAGGGSIVPPDRSCDDLSTFCATSCSHPASVAADCQAIASAGDPQSCASWQLTSGALCRP